MSDNGNDRQEILCPACRTQFVILHSLPTPSFCPYCQALLKPTKSPQHTLIIEQSPKTEEILFSVGPYAITKKLGKGGMGEVYLAYDTRYGRDIALKKIRTDLKEHVQIQERFLKEARITCLLTHPAIIPIYSIHKGGELTYYTMPYVEGKTLREILVETQEQIRQGGKVDHLGTIPALIRIFFSVCQAVAYAHSKQVIHRDLKPNNIIVGRYGEVLILDWGLAKMVTQTAPESIEEFEFPKDLSPNDATRIGRVVGTVAYLSPERVRGQPATVQSDVYALGIILYQILTLRHPFHRKSLAELRKYIKDEPLYDPAEIAPYRDVPPLLSRITLLCLAPSVEERYKSVDELIHDLESYLEGRSEWFQVSALAVNIKSDWEFKENVLIAEHTAITRGTEVSEWVQLMVSAASFPGNIRLEAKVRIGEKGQGIGFLLSVPEAAEREHPNSGYCLWLASDLNKSTRLLHSTVEVMASPEVFLQRHALYKVRIEKIEKKIYFYLNDILQFSYISHLPLQGTHIGLMARDADFTIENLTVSVGSQNIMVNCLAIPDAFLSHKHYNAALSEYRRIAYAFPGTAEAREALFRAGITLLEKARQGEDVSIRERLSEETLDEFEKLRGTPGAPLEYLGKALVYQMLDDYEEEAKCFELAYRRYPQHPLLYLLQDHLIHRMNAYSRYHRKGTYLLVLIAIRYLIPISLAPHVHKLFASLKRNWEPLYFIDEENTPENLQHFLLAIPLAFWLAKTYVLEETIEELIRIHAPPVPMLINALFALIELGAWKQAKHKKEHLQERLQRLEALDSKTKIQLDLVQLAIDTHFHPLPKVMDRLLLLLTLQKERGYRTTLHLLDIALDKKEYEIIYQFADKIAANSLIHMSYNEQIYFDCYRIWAFLAEKNWSEAGKILHSYPSELLAKETNLLHFLYGCWLWVVESQEIAIIHFTSILEVPHPRSWTLFSHFFNKNKKEQQLILDKTFLWERKQLYRQLTLFYACIGDQKQEDKYQTLAKKTYS